MFKQIIIYHFLNLLKDFRFILSFSIVLTVFILGSVLYVQSQRTINDHYQSIRQSITDKQKRLAEQSATDLAITSQEWTPKPRSSNFISDCNEHILPTSFMYSAYAVNGFKNSKNKNNPYLQDYQKLDWSFIVTYFLSFIALLFTFDMVSEESENGILRLLLSNSVSRGILLFGKYIASIISVASIFFFGSITSLLILLVTKSISLKTEFIMEYLNYSIITFVFIALLSAIGMLFSIISSKSNISVLYALIFWLFMIIIIPNSTLFFAEKIFQIEPLTQIEESINVARQELWDNAPRDAKNLNRLDPFDPSNEKRAELVSRIFNIENEMRHNYYKQMFDQYQYTQLICMISPASLFNYTVEIALDGGYRRFMKNWNNIHIYQSQFLYFFKKIDASDPNSPHWYNPGESLSTTKKSVSFESIPVFKEPHENYTKRIQQQVLPLVIFIISLGIVLLLSLISFVRYNIVGSN